MELASFYSRDANDYVMWLKQALELLHQGVRQNRSEGKTSQKEAYDRRHGVKQPKYVIGQKVLLRDQRVKPGSDFVLTKKPFVGPYLIKDIVQYSESIGPAYQLIDEQTGKELPKLITHDRLKAFYQEQEVLKSTKQKEGRKEILQKNEATACVSTLKPSQPPLVFVNRKRSVKV